jgi:post-segregation antitoxin (ccd killing protein)
MRTPLYDVRGRKKTVSVTINADLWEKARAAGLNLSEVAETAIAAAFVTVERARIQAEIEQELEIYNEFVAEHGSFADMMREREAVRERDEAV